MRGVTHLASGIFLISLFLFFFPSSFPSVFFIGLLAGSLLPDIDTPFSLLGRHVRIIGHLLRHRGILHTPLFGLLLGIILWMLIGAEFSLGLLIGYLTHLLLDSLTKKGIPFIGSKRLVGPFKSFGIFDLLLFFSFLILSVLMVLVGL